LHGVVLTQGQDSALGLVEPTTAGLAPSIQPFQIPLQSLPTLKQINTPTQMISRNSDTYSVDLQTGEPTMVNKEKYSVLCHDSALLF